MPGVVVRKVENDQSFHSGDMKVFIEFPWRVYKNDPNWVPPLLSMRRGMFDRKKNPEWDYIEGENYIAWRGEEPVGIISAFTNQQHMEIWHEKLGFFGFFECYDDQEAANALLQAAAEYARGKGMTGLRGPLSFTLNEETALLIENFSMPVILMPYNPPYYQRLIETSGIGLSKVMDLESWRASPAELRGAFDDEITKKLERVTEKTKTKYGVTVVRPKKETMKEDLQKLHDVYAEAWSKNWGDIPPTDREMDKLFRDLRDYYDPSLACFAYVNGEIAAFLLGLPDMNQVLHKAYARPDVPEIITLLKAAWYWKIKPFLTRKPGINRARVLLFGVKPQFRLKGVDAAVLLEMFRILMAHPIYLENDTGWFLEINQPMLELCRTMHLTPYKRYRFYQCDVNAIGAPAK